MTVSGTAAVGAKAVIGHKTWLERLCKEKLFVFSQHYPPRGTLWKTIRLS